MFEKIKKNWQKRIETNAFKSNLTYVNKEGMKLLKQGYSEESLPDYAKTTEEVYFKRSLFYLGDWVRIYPPINESGSINWINFIFGGRKNLVKLLMILGVVAAVFMQFYQDFTLIESLKEALSNCNINLNGLI